jgi:hypothetical protein
VNVNAIKFPLLGFRLLFLICIGFQIDCVQAQRSTAPNAVDFAQHISIWEGYIKDLGGVDSISSLVNLKFIEPNQQAILESVANLSQGGKYNKALLSQIIEVSQTFLKTYGLNGDTVNLLLNEIETSLQKQIIDNESQLNMLSLKMTETNNGIDLIMTQEPHFDSARLKADSTNLAKLRTDSINFKLDWDSLYSANEKISLRIIQNRDKIQKIRAISIQAFRQELDSLKIAKSYSLARGMLFVSNEAYEISIFNSYKEVTSGVPQRAIPTQTEIIDAVAVLIASRVKEEVTLTFFNTLSKNLANDSLLKVFFPRTSYLFNSVENFTMPSIGAASI